MSLASVASACLTAAWYGRGSMVKSGWPFVTSSPSAKWTAVSSPDTRGRTLTVATTLTEPLARTSTGMVLTTAAVTVTGAGGGGGGAAGGLAQPRASPRASAEAAATRPLGRGRRGTWAAPTRSLRRGRRPGRRLASFYRRPGGLHGLSGVTAGPYLGDDPIQHSERGTLVPRVWGKRPPPEDLGGLTSPARCVARGVIARGFDWPARRPGRYNRAHPVMK